MTRLDEIKEVLWLYSTHERHPFQENEASANLEGFGDLVIDGLIWGLQQDDFDLKLTVLVLLRADRYPPPVSTPYLCRNVNKEVAPIDARVAGVWPARDA